MHATTDSDDPSRADSAFCASQPKPRRRQAKGPTDESLFTTKALAFSSHLKRIAESELVQDRPSLLCRAGSASSKELQASIQSRIQEKIPSSPVKKRSRSGFARRTSHSSPIHTHASLYESKPCAIVISSDDNDSSDEKEIKEAFALGKPLESHLTACSTDFFGQLETKFFPSTRPVEALTASSSAYQLTLSLFPPSQLDRLIQPEHVTLSSNESFESYFESYRERHALPISLVWAAEATRIYPWASPASLTLASASQGRSNTQLRLYAFTDADTWKSHEKEFFSHAQSWQDYILGLEIELAAKVEIQSECQLRARTTAAASACSASSSHVLRLQLKGPQGGSAWIVQVDPLTTTWAVLLDGYKKAHHCGQSTAAPDQHYSLWFDGERLELKALVSTAELEDDDCIEVHGAANKSFCS